MSPVGIIKARFDYDCTKSKSKVNYLLSKIKYHQLFEINVVWRLPEPHLEGFDESPQKSPDPLPSAQEFDQPHHSEQAEEGDWDASAILRVLREGKQEVRRGRKAWRCSFHANADDEDLWHIHLLFMQSVTHAFSGWWKMNQHWSELILPLMISVVLQGHTVTRMQTMP